MIYFAQADISGQIKIGFHGGTDANDRLRELQTGCPTKLVLLGTIPGEKETETDLHKRFAFAHAHGEWFNPVPDLLAYIGAQSAGHELNGTRVESRFVQIKILTVGKKSFTQALFRQLSYRSFIDWHHSTSDALATHGVPWGWVRIIDNDRGPQSYLVWQAEGQLYKWCIDHYFPVLEACQTLFRHRFTEKDKEDVSNRFDNAYDFARQGWLALDQLFIGV